MFTDSYGRFFFFQAEDGIRDVAVTGVQTCALPISFRQVAIKGGHTLSMEAWQSWVNDPWYHLVFNFHTKSKFTNMPFYSNTVLDRLIDESMHDTNTERRLGSTRVAQKILIDDAVWGFLWYDSWTRVMKADLSGMEKRWDTFERYYAVKRV